MAKLKKLIESKIRTSRNRKSIWFELFTTGVTDFVYGSRYDVSKLEGEPGIIFTPNPDGKYRVSARNANNPDKPTKEIVEHFSPTLNETFEVGQPIRIEIHTNKIVIKLHHSVTSIQRREGRIKHKIRQGIPLNGLSMCMGGGGLDLSVSRGLEQSKISTRVAIASEYERKYLEPCLRNNPELFDENTLVLEGDMRSFPVNQNRNEVDFAVIGIPCEPSSLAGRTRNGNALPEQNERTGTIPFHILCWLQSFNPAFAILENVEGFSRSGSFYMVINVLKELGYKLSVRTLSGNEFGAIEDRSRLSIVALSEGIDEFDIDAVMPSNTKLATVNDILDNVPLDSEMYKPYEYIFTKEQADIKANKGFRAAVYTGSEAKLNCILKGYHKGRSGEPLLAHPKIAGLYRLLTEAEHARAKTLPLQMIKGVSTGIAHQICGQSVIYNAFFDLAAALGKTIHRWAMGNTINMQSA
ncbi:DNA cytosine methyltransferase [Vibrio parahaemolyticus]|jgi:DNA (cytosine-5)-methyltransferase 1|uniref:DNA cytosine methyltransferase n=1 Tax=Vibrio parahaemolyticus TaxID=670 RepID=UPI0024BCB09E|nr:DNA cytosine methyltransferase [Vibrio parahaemolyticus]WHT06141.1 DNA cytosine methyltransferase [Vibrio parahaemolyticus]